MSLSIETFRRQFRGPVALLGGGESAGSLDLEAIAAEMPVIGINGSWQVLETPWRVFVDHHLQDFSREETVFYPLATGKPAPPFPPSVTPVPIRWRPREGRDPEFLGFRLDEGTHAYFAGMLALEVATWCGFNPIRPLGFDCAGGYFYDPEKRTPGGAGTHAEWAKLLEAAIAELAEAGVEVVRG